jgi:hypothetical protein
MSQRRYPSKGKAYEVRRKPLSRRDGIALLIAVPLLAVIGFAPLLMGPGGPMRWWDYILAALCIPGMIVAVIVAALFTNVHDVSNAVMSIANVLIYGSIFYALWDWVKWRGGKSPPQPGA